MSDDERDLLQRIGDAYSLEIEPWGDVPEGLARHLEAKGLVDVRWDAVTQTVTLTDKGRKAIGGKR
jgi:hypothetical protein